MPKRCCGTCAFAKFEMTKHDPPRIKPKSATRCLWRTIIVFPDSVPERDRIFRPNYVTADFGQACPCWQAQPCEVSR